VVSKASLHRMYTRHIHMYFTYTWNILDQGGSGQADWLADGWMDGRSLRDYCLNFLE